MNQLHEYLAEFNTLTPTQFGFRHGHSTILQLLNYHLDWVSNQNNGFATDVVFLDFQKTFDSVVHLKLLIKLAGYGIHYELLSWIKNFLGNRSYCVIINEEYSSR